jgi:hypothetical protein
MHWKERKGKDMIFVEYNCYISCLRKGNEKKRKEKKETGKGKFTLPGCKIVN